MGTQNLCTYAKKSHSIHPALITFVASALPLFQGAAKRDRIHTLRPRTQFHFYISSSLILDIKILSAEGNKSILPFI